MNHTESQEKGSSSENEAPVNPMPLSLLKPVMKVPLSTLKKSYDQGNIIHINEDDRKSPRKKRPWDSEEE